MSDRCDSVRVVTAEGLEYAIDEVSTTIEVNTNILRAEVAELKSKFAKLVSILPPELKLAFELTDDIPERSGE